METTETGMTNDNDDLAKNAGLGNGNQTSPSAVDVEREPMPDHAPKTESDKPRIPPARNGSASEAPEKVTEGDPLTNPVHHTGHIPPPVTANRE